MASPFLIAMSAALAAQATPAPTTTPAPAAQPAPAESAAPAAMPGPAVAPVPVTPADPATAQAPAAEPIPAAATDLVDGAIVRGSDRQPLGTIEAADAQGATVSTGSARARLPLSNFRKDEQGLLIAVTRAQFEQAVGGRPQAGSN